MKKIIVYLTLCTFALSAFGCAYDSAYRDYSLAQANIAQAAGPIVSFHPDGKLASVGNPMVAMAMMNMKEPKDGWTQFFDFLKFATPFAAIYGIAGAFSSANHGSTTNVSGSGNFMGNQTGTSSPIQYQSPITTTTTELPPFLIAE